MADAHSGPVLLGGIGGKIGVSMPPAGYFLRAQKVPKDAQETAWFLDFLFRRQVGYR